MSHPSPTLRNSRARPHLPLLTEVVEANADAVQREVRPISPKSVRLKAIVDPS